MDRILFFGGLALVLAFAILAFIAGWTETPLERCVRKYSDTMLVLRPDATGADIERACAVVELGRLAT